MDPPAVLKVKVEAQSCHPALSVRCTPLLCALGAGAVAVMAPTQAAHSGVDAVKCFMQSIRVLMTQSFNVLPCSLHGLFKAHRRDRSTFFCSASVPPSIAIAWRARSLSPTYWLYTLAVLTRPAQRSRTAVLASALAAPMW